MKLDIYVNYPGTCAAAFRFYERHLGGKITMMRTHEDQPNQPSVPADWKKAILHARIEIGKAVLMGADIPGGQCEGDGAPLRAACRGWPDLHEDGADVFRESVRHAARPVWHVVDAAA